MMPWDSEDPNASRREGGMRLFSWFSADPVTDADVRAEIWKLGTRHRGQPLEGALEELKAPDLSSRNASLLRACVRKLRRA